MKTKKSEKRTLRLTQALNCLIYRQEDTGQQKLI